MANYSNLKAAIAAAIKTNGNQEITGQVLQDVLTSVVSVIGANYTFAGVAIPSTNPGTPDQNVFYFATQLGTYSNFGSISITERSLFVFLWNGTWTNIDLLNLDDYYQDLDALVTQFEQQLRQMLEEYQPIVIEGNVTNAPDEEDLTSVDGLLRFKNRNTLYGMGCIYLRRELGFAEQLTQENTIYVIRYDYTLTASVTIPANCVLEFDGGSISGAYTVTGNNTGIKAGIIKILNTDVTLAGTWNIDAVSPEWFYNSGTDTASIEKAILFAATIKSKVVFTKKDYYIDSSISLQLPGSIHQGLILEGHNNSAVIHCVGGIDIFTGSCGFMIIRNLTFFSDTHSTGSALNIVAYNLLVENCYFYNFNIATRLGGVVIKVDNCYYADNENGIVLYKKTNINTCFDITNSIFIGNNYGIRDDMYDETVEGTSYNVGTCKKINIDSCIIEKNQTKGIVLIWCIIGKIENCWFENNPGGHKFRDTILYINNIYEPSDGAIELSGDGHFSKTDVDYSRVKSTSFDFSLIYNKNELAKLKMSEYTSTDKHDILIKNDENPATKQRYLLSTINSNNATSIVSIVRSYYIRNGVKQSGPSDIELTISESNGIYSITFGTALYGQNIIISPNSGGEKLVPLYYTRYTSDINSGIANDCFNKIEIEFHKTDGTLYTSSVSFNITIISNN